MINKGTIKKYNQERGFGFILSDDSNTDIFFHIKDFPNKNILPQVGEKVTFHIGQDGGKNKAIHITRLDFPSESVYNTKNERLATKSKRKLKKNNTSGDLFGVLMAVIFIGIVGIFVYGFIQKALHRNELANQPVTHETLAIANTQAINNNANNFKCDGRIHCSQMHSKEEAQWFLNNCPGTKMDGDRDGDACEGQFGSGW